jgi:hypothetical protein
VGGAAAAAAVGPAAAIHYSDAKVAKDLLKLELEAGKKSAASKKTKPLNKKMAKALYQEYSEIEGATSDTYFLLL